MTAYSRARILDSLGRAKDLQAHNVAILVVVQNETRLFLVALLNRDAAQHNSQDINFRVAGDFQVTLQYLASLLVRHTVATSSGSRSSRTIARQKDPTSAKVQLRLIRFPSRVFKNDLLWLLQDQRQQVVADRAPLELIRGVCRVGTSLRLNL